MIEVYGKNEEGEERLVKRIYRTTVKDNRGRGRLQKRWKGDLKGLLMG